MMFKATKAAHLTATMRVLRFHYARPSLSIRDARDAVKDLALRVGAGDASRDDYVLEEKLRRATGVSVVELAHSAEDWLAA
jgi:hypothetical protein